MKSVFSCAALLAILLAWQSFASAGSLEDRQGRWLGELKIPDGPTLRLGAELYRRADGTAWASVASPDQGVIDIPVSAIREDGATLALTLSSAELTLTWAEDRFKGVWTQDKAPLAFELRQVEEFPMKARPQTPQAPFPYRNETLAISTVHGLSLGATLSIPDGVARPDVVVLVAGSGPAARDAQLFGHQTFAVLADDLARRGIAVLRYDKRGVARSTGNYERHTVADLVDDLGGVIRALQARREFGRLGLVGHSEGAHVAAAAAARLPHAVDFVVSLAGVGLRGMDMILLQDRVWARDRGASPAEAERAMAYVRRFYRLVLAHRQPGPRVAALTALYAALPPQDQALIRKLDMNQGTLSLAWASQPFLRASLLADPPADWRAVRAPVLALGGALDHQVPAAENVAGIVAALHAGGNRQVESQILPSLNHMLQTASTGREDEYDSIDETLSPALMRRVADFVLAGAGSRRREPGGMALAN